MSNQRVKEIQHFLGELSRELKAIESLKNENFQDVIISRQGFRDNIKLASDLKITHGYIHEVIKPILMAKMAEQEKIIKGNIAQYGKELQELMKEDN